MAEQLIRTGKVEHAALGVAAAPVTGEDGRAGVRLEQVTAGGADAGLRTGDVVVAVDGTAVQSVDELVLDLRDHHVGQSVDVSHLRDDRERTAQVGLAARCLTAGNGGTTRGPDHRQAGE